MFEVGRLIARIGLEGAATFGRDLRQIGTEFRKLDEEGKRAATEVGTALAGVGAGLLAVSALTAKAAIDWQSSWAGVTKTVNGTDAELAMLEDDLRSLTKILPATHGEIAAVAEAAGQLGIQTENVAAFTRTMIDLGETTNLSATEAATQLARFMNVMGTAQNRVSNLGSAVVGLGNNYATTEAEIVAMAMRLSGAARVVKLSEGETLGLATALSSVGIEAEAGGSAISKVMIDIAGSVEAGGDRLETFARISGMSSSAFVTQWRSKPGEALAAFVKGLAAAEGQGSSTLSVLDELGITEVRMRDALLRSSAAADMFTGAMEQGSAEFENNNALADEAAKRYATVEAQLSMTWNAVVDLAIELGEHLLPAITDVTDSARGFIDFLGSLPDPLQAGVVWIGLATGAALLFGGTLLLAVPKIVEFRLALATLNTQLPTLAGRLAGVTRVLGPLGIAITAAMVVMPMLTDAIDQLLDKSTEFENGLTGATNAQQLFLAAMQTDISTTSLSTSNQYLGKLNDALLDARENWKDWTKGISNENQVVLDAVQEYGRYITEIGQTDFGAAANGFRLLAEETDGSRGQLWALLSRMPEFRDAVMEQATALGINVTEMSDAERQQTLLDIALGKTTTSTLENADAVDTLSVMVDGVVVSLKDMYDELNAINDANLDARESARDFQEALDDFDASLKENGKTLDITTEAGRRNEAALDAIADAAMRNAQAILEAGGSEEEYRKALTDGREAILTRIEDLGIEGQAAQDLADTILDMPSDKEIEIRVRQEQARAMLAQFVKDWEGKTISIAVSPYIPASRIRAINAELARWTGQGLNQANGGVVEYYAGGGVRENHVAQIAQAGTVRVWAEPETEGEAYIPLAESKRGRSTDVLANVADRFGYALVPKGEDGGMTGMDAPVDEQPSARGRNVTLQIINPVAVDPVRSAREAADIIEAESHV